MNCLECGGTYTEKSGIYVLDDPYVGEISIKGVPYYQCDKCEDILYSAAMAKAIESERNKRIHERLSQFPISDFIGAAETASILGISRQALNKNRRINHGFIYQTKIAGLTVYLRQSVLKYKRTLDGRSPLHFHYYGTSPTYVEDTSRTKITPVYKSYPEIIKIGAQFTQGTHARPKEHNYAS